MDELFFVVATQNPVEFPRHLSAARGADGPLSAMCIALGYVDAEVETEVARGAGTLAHPLAGLRAVARA